MSFSPLAPGWQFDVTNSTEWLFLRLQRLQAEAEACPPIAEKAWDLASEHHVKRLVFELDDDTMVTSYLIGQLVLLHKRVTLAGGVFRLCGFSADNYRVLQLMQLAGRLPNFRDRESAVMGHLTH